MSEQLHDPDVPPPNADPTDALFDDDILDIAERTLWNLDKVSRADVQRLAGVVIAHIRRLRSLQQH